MERNGDITTTPPRRRVAVTGLGAITPLGLTAGDFWNNLLAGASGIGPMTLCDPTDYPCRIAGQADDFNAADYIPAREARRMARFSQLAVAAAQQAVADARLDIAAEDAYRVGVLLGNGNGGFPTLEDNCRILATRGGMRMSPFFFPMILPNMAAANVSHYVGARGYNSTATTACAASNNAIGEAAQAIRHGMADVMLAGGAEAGISQLGLAGFAVMRALSVRNDDPQRASRPFDAQPGTALCRPKAPASWCWRSGSGPWRGAPTFSVKSPGSGPPPTPAIWCSPRRTGPALPAP